MRFFVRLCLIIYTTTVCAEKLPFTTHELIANIPTKKTTFNTLPATKAARQWLNLMDQQHFAQAWQQASVTIRQTISEPKFIQQAQAQRQPLGRPIERRIVTSLPRTQLPQGPEGKYVIAQFQGQYQHREAVKELLVVQLDPDQHWRVAAYFLK